MKRTVIIALLLLVIVSTVSCSSTDGRSQIKYENSASWAEGFRTIDEMSRSADLIVLGTVGQVVEQTQAKAGDPRWGTQYIYVSDYQFKLEKVIRGTCASEIIVRQTGKDENTEMRDDPLFRPSERYVLFLRQSEPNKYYVLGGPQGRYRVVQDRVFSMNFVSPDRNITLPEELAVNGLDKDLFIQSIRSNQ